jgi:esterase
VEKLLMRTIESRKLRQFVLKNLYWRERGKMGWRLNIKAINENLHAVFEGVTVSGEYGGPSLFIRGGLSGYISDEDLEMIRKKFPGAVVKTIAQATHWVHADAPGEFYEIVSGFLIPRQ